MIPDYISKWQNSLNESQQFFDNKLNYEDFKSSKDAPMDYLSKNNHYNLRESKVDPSQNYHKINIPLVIEGRQNSMQRSS